ncbi:MAG: prepilin-type N-terminal cleavage/methylation domain-containing protein [Candidatus Hydrogenedentes bacterium]|nr:prepilin-type N-terminal cleavage/methylation domain-containing protein [Candidatus Hydrogenedentota bacterium]
MNSRGFTLVELVISMAILAIISVLGVVALQTSTTSMATAESKADVQDNVRDVLAAMTRELQMASKVSDDSLTPPLDAVAVNANPAAGSPTELVFQIPTSGSGRNWSRAIRYRYINEDANENGRLDSGEDLDSDGVLSRRIVRIQDLNADGDTADTGETMPVGGANDLSGVQFARTGDVITITLTSEKFLSGRRSDPVRVTVSSDVYLQN